MNSRKKSFDQTLVGALVAGTIDSRPRGPGFESCRLSLPLVSRNSAKDFNGGSCFSLSSAAWDK